MINIHVQNIQRLEALIAEENDPALKAHLMVQLSVVYTLIEMTNKIHDNEIEVSKKFNGFERRAGEIEKKNKTVDDFISKIKWTVGLFSFAFSIVSIGIGNVAFEVYNIVSTIKKDQIQLTTKMEMVIKDARLYTVIPDEHRRGGP